MVKYSLIISVLLILASPSLLQAEPLEELFGNKPIDVEVKQLPGFVPNEHDDSIEIVFNTPDGMVENEELAREYGIHKIYRAQDPSKAHPESIIGISFSKKKEKSEITNLNLFVASNAFNMRKLFPDSELTVGLLTLPEEVVKKFKDLAIPYQATLLLLDTKDGRPLHTSAIFYFETPAGFWSINWTGSREILESEGKNRDLFLTLIYNTDIIIK